MTKHGGNHNGCYVLRSAQTSIDDRQVVAVYPDIYLRICRTRVQCDDSKIGVGTVAKRILSCSRCSVSGLIKPPKRAGRESSNNRGIRNLKHLAGETSRLEDVGPV